MHPPTSLLGLLTVVLVLGLGIWLFPQGKEDRIVNLTTGERAWVEAKEKGDRGTELVATDPDAALGLCREAWRAMLAEIGLGLEHRLDDPIGLLSGGQRQSITLLMATAQAPKVLLLDEHTAALDPRSAEQVIQLTSRIVSRHQATTIMVTHSMAQAAALGDRLVAMHRGRVYLDVSGAEKRRMRPEDLHDLFAQMRRDDQLDPAALDLLAREYA